MKSRAILLAALSVACVLSLPLAGCAPTPEYQKLTRLLQDRGHRVSDEPNFANLPFLSAIGQELMVDTDKTVQVFEYSNTVSARTEAGTIAQDGTPPQPKQWKWGKKPHFFLSEKSIITYIGTDEKIIESLTAIYGNPFAQGR